MGYQLYTGLGVPGKNIESPFVYALHGSSRCSCRSGGDESGTITPLTELYFADFK